MIEFPSENLAGPGQKLPCRNSQRPGSGLGMTSARFLSRMTMGTHKEMARLLFKILCPGIMSALVVLGCATVEPEPRQSAVPVVGSQGPLDPARRAGFLEAMTEWSDSEVVSSLLDDVIALSQTPLYMDNEVRLLIDGPATYESMISAINGAKHHVLLESYIFADDEVGTMFAELLKKRSREGIVVKVIYDSFGSSGNEVAFFEQMQAAGIELLEFNALNPLKGDTPLDFNNRDHRKILVVDGTVAFTGGINLSSTYSTNSSWPTSADPKQSGWRDTHIEIRGPAAEGFQQLFLQSWVVMGGDSVTSLYTPTDEAGSGREIVAILSARGGDEVRSEIFEAYLSAIAVAKKRIWITQAYFAPDKEFMDALKRAARRGVDVRVMVPGVSDSNAALNASRSRYRELMEAGAAVYERQNALLHAKTAVIDGIWSTVGSSNLDNRSFLHNDEANAIIIGHRFAEEMQVQFEKDERSSVRIDLSSWKDRSFWKRLKEKLSWIAEYWI
jgi:cardiolipin synthase